MKQKIFSLILATVLCVSSFSSVNAVTYTGVIGGSGSVTSSSYAATYTGTIKGSGSSSSTSSSSSSLSSSSDYDFYSLTTDYDTINERMYWSETSSLKKYYSLSEEVSNGNSVTLTNAESWLEYYSYKYRIYECNGYFNYSWEGNTYTIESSETSSTRAKAVSAVIKKFGVEKVTDATQAVKNAAARINAGLTYNYNYFYKDMITAVSNGQGVCVHFANALAIILNAEGVPCRTVAGYCDGTLHMWNEVYINGSWTTVDCSGNSNGFVSGGHSYSKFSF